MEKEDKAAKIAKLAKGITTVAGIAGIALFTVYWFDLDDKLVEVAATKLKKKAEAFAAAQEA
jgi:hypothetical protein